MTFFCPPLEYAAHILVTKLQDICCEENRQKMLVVVRQLGVNSDKCIKCITVFSYGRTGVRAVEDCFHVSVKLLAEDGAVVHVTRVNKALCCVFK